MRYYFHMPRSVQTLGINLVELRAWAIHRSKIFFDFLALLKETEQWDNERFEAYQSKHMRTIVNYAYRHVPFYRRLYDDHGVDISQIRTVDDLEQLPIITKADLSSNYTQLISPVEKRPLQMGTSGTTGTPLHFLISREQDVLNYAIAYRRDLWGGYTRDSLIARFVGDKPVKDCNDRSLVRRSYLMNRLIFPSYCLSSDNFPRIFDILRKHRVKFIQAYPSTAYILAKYLEFEDTYYDLDALFYSSEPMYDHQREFIEKRFHTQFFGFYGQRERIISATECSENRYHLSMIDGITEIVRNGEVLADGEKGFTVTTSLHNYAMPFIRYALNDFTGYTGNSCDCGRTLPTIFPVDAWLGDFIVSPKGMIYSALLFLSPTEGMRNIAESQVIQEDVDRISINIVTQEGFSTSDYLRLKDSFDTMFGSEFELKINLVNNIPQTGSFKKRFAINKLGEDYIEKAFERE